MPIILFLHLESCAPLFNDPQLNLLVSLSKMKSYHQLSFCSQLEAFEFTNLRYLYTC
jgi:hypothetical protein